ncbi:hypothetical protein Lesp02_42930 [Lentzea sp. NBRC 105346]|nr:hypothetical protein Lesp02_42930 [Lentzea sp. NBRC 105346]
MRGNWSSVGVDSKVSPSSRSNQFSDSPTNTFTNELKPSRTHAVRSVMPHSESAFAVCGGLTVGGADVVDGGDGGGGGGALGCAAAVAVARPSNTATMLSNKATRQRRGRNVGGVLAAIAQAPTIPLRISTTSGASAAKP